MNQPQSTSGKGCISELDLLSVALQSWWRVAVKYGSAPFICLFLGGDVGIGSKTGIYCSSLNSHGEPPCWITAVAELHAQSCCVGIFTHGQRSVTYFQVRMAYSLGKNHGCWCPHGSAALVLVGGGGHRSERHWCNSLVSKCSAFYKWYTL